MISRSNKQLVSFILNEIRRMKQSDPEIEVYKQTIDKYSGERGVLASYSTMDGKLGINPSNQTYDPTGIYGYPLELDSTAQEVKDNSVRNFQERPYLYIFGFKDPSKVLYIGREDDDKSQLKAVTNKLKTMLGEDEYTNLMLRTEYNIPSTIELGTSTLMASQLYNIVVKFAGREKNWKPVVDKDGQYIKYMHGTNKNAKEQKLIADNPEEYGFFKIGESEDSYFHKAGSPGYTGPASASKLFMKLGFHGVIDITNSGVISEYEPSQGVAFSSKFINVYEQIVNPYAQLSTKLDRDRKSDTFGKQISYNKIDDDAFFGGSEKFLEDFFNMIASKTTKLGNNKELAKAFWRFVKEGHNVLGVYVPPQSFLEMIDVRLFPLSNDPGRLMIADKLFGPENRQLYAPVSDSQEVKDLFLKLFMLYTNPKILEIIGPWIGLQGNDISYSNTLINRINTRFKAGKIPFTNLIRFYRDGVQSENSKAFSDGLLDLKNTTTGEVKRDIEEAINWIVQR